ncbi:MAG TPA: IS110 family transposase [Terriglobia bacterium]|nr:IS110 family transposase [Terriglobia bacterium]
MNKHDVCGIEVSAAQLLAGLEREGATRTRREFPNTPQGHQALVNWLGAPGRTVRVVMEATGLYGLDLALRLDAGTSFELMIANPRAVRHFAHALMKRSKNDPMDTDVLVEFARRMPFQPWARPSAAALALHALAHRLESLTEMHAAEKNRLHAAQLSPALPAAVVRDLQRSLRSLERALDRLTRQAVQIIGADPDLNRRYPLLLSACGIGPTSAVQILAQLAVLAPNLGVRQWVAYAGLDPRQYSSGRSVHKKVRISKTGNRHLRRALYMPALVAIRHQPHLRAFYQHLLARGKAKMQALVAVMRKLLHAIFGMFKHHQPFDGARLCSLPVESSQPLPTFSTTEAP